MCVFTGQKMRKRVFAPTLTGLSFSNHCAAEPFWKSQWYCRIKWTRPQPHRLTDYLWQSGNRQLWGKISIPWPITSWCRSLMVVAGKNIAKAYILYYSDLFCDHVLLGKNVYLQIGWKKPWNCFDHQHIATVAVWHWPATLGAVGKLWKRAKHTGKVKVAPCETGFYFEGKPPFLVCITLF